jgi:hypothetical protein
MMASRGRVFSLLSVIAAAPGGTVFFLRSPLCESSAAWRRFALLSLRRAAAWRRSAPFSFCVACLAAYFFSPGRWLAEASWGRLAFFSPCCGALQPGGASASSLAWRAAMHKLQLCFMLLGIFTRTSMQELGMYSSLRVWCGSRRRFSVYGNQRRLHLFFSHKSVLLHAQGSRRAYCSLAALLYISSPRAGRCAAAAVTHSREVAYSRK